MRGVRYRDRRGGAIRHAAAWRRDGEVADTDSRNTSANTLYYNLRTIQGPADIEWPEGEPSNRSQREKFRIGFFPPPRSQGDQPPATPPQPN